MKIQLVKCSSGDSPFLPKLAWGGGPSEGGWRGKRAAVQLPLHRPSDGPPPHRADGEERRKCLVLSAILAMSLPAPALAQETTEILPLGYSVRDDTITVLATGHGIPIADAGQSVTTVGAAELASIQGPDLTRVLERLPGVSFSRNGGLGAQTGVNVRGANADQLLVLVDGVRIADYASPGGGYDLGNLLAGELARVELLRGSNSVVWGSQAIGGVFAVDTREASGAVLAGEFGAYDTATASATAGLSGEHFGASLTAGYARTDGFSAMTGGTEADGYRQWRVSGKARAQLADGLVLRAVGRHADSKLDIDQFGANSPDRQFTKENTGRLGLDYDSGDFALRGGVTYGEVRRHYESAFGPFGFTGRAWRAEVSGHAPLPAGLGLDFGADSEWSRSTGSFDPAARARSSSAHALLGWHRDSNSLSAGIRIDDHSRFGTHATLGANGSVWLGNWWRLRASYGEGFKAPTLYQLHGGFVGNPDLKPETSRSADIGIEHRSRGDDGFHFALTAFHRNSRNLIDLDSNFVYRNVSRARSQGIELELGARPTARWHVQAAYTLLDAQDRTAKRALARRPHHTLTLSSDWTTPLAGLEIGADLRMASDSVEYPFAGAKFLLDGYAAVTLRARLPLSERIEITARVENLTDTAYETAANFGTAGRSAYIGARARF
jgi:vitamin B12 transporter